MWELYGIITWLVDIQTIQTIHKIDISGDERKSDPWDNSHRFWLLWLIVGEEWWINRHFELSNGDIFWSSNMEIGWKGIHHVYIDSLVFEVKGSWDFLLSAWITGGRLLTWDDSWIGTRGYFDIMKWHVITKTGGVCVILQIIAMLLLYRSPECVFLGKLQKPRSVESQFSARK
jgi:hypothetical protein